MSAKQALCYGAAAATAIAGIMHLIMAPNSLANNINSGILFLVGGLAQVFWAVPMVRQWGPAWYSIGMGGTAAFVAIWTITRIAENPITGRAGNISQNGIIVETAQLVFIGLIIAVLAYEKRKQQKTVPVQK